MFFRQNYTLRQTWAFYEGHIWPDGCPCLAYLRSGKLENKSKHRSPFDSVAFRLHIAELINLMLFEMGKIMSKLLLVWPSNTTQVSQVDPCKNPLPTQPDSP